MSWQYTNIIEEVNPVVNYPQQDSWTVTVANPHDETDTRDVTMSVGKTRYSSVGFLEGVDYNHDGEINSTSVDYSTDEWRYGSLGYSFSNHNYHYEEITLVRTPKFDNGLMIKALPQ